MTSHYLVADETARHMTAALGHLPCGCLDNERERRVAYRAADVRFDDMVQHDAEALRLERLRRRLFGVVIGATTGVAHPVAAAERGTTPADYRHDAVLAAKVMGVEFLAIGGLFAALFVLTAFRRALCRQDRRRAVLREDWQAYDGGS